MRNLPREILSIIGFFSAAYGIYTVYPPASFIVSGVFLVWISIPGGRK